MIAMMPFAALAQEQWPQQDWDPANAAPDLVLPLPCEGSLAMRRVDTPTEASWLADMKIRLGTVESPLPYADSIRADTIAGSLAEEQRPDQRHYYLGIYEVTTRQWKAVMDSCDVAMSEGSDLPVEDATWFEAIAFTEKLNAWLLAHRPDALSPLGGNGGFVRLPTEAEWEFAARGGMAVPDVETRRAPMYPMDADLERYAHHLGQDSCDGRAWPIGEVKPNPLGLYDIVGNVSELVQEPFRLNAKGRLHGQAGAFITRGGSCLTSREDVTTALREEMPALDFDNRQFFRSDFIGFRIAVTGMALPPTVNHDDIASDFENLSASLTGDGAENALGDVLARIDDEETARLVSTLASEFQTEIARREEVHQRSVRSSIVSGAFMARSYHIDSDRFRSLKPRCDPPNDLTEAQRAGYDRACALSKQVDERRNLTRSLYGDLIARMADDVSLNDIKAQVSLAADSVGHSNMARDFARLFVCQVMDYSKASPAVLDSYFLSIESRDLSGCTP